MTDRRVKECIIFNPETGISEDGTMHDGVYRQWINKPKKERKMTREEAIQIIEGNRLYYRDWKQGEFDKALERLKEPLTIADLLGWEEEPRYLLQTDLESENGVQYLSFDKKRSKYFIGALIASENVQQRFTDDEISKIKSITRFAKLCEKVEVE